MYSAPLVMSICINVLYEVISMLFSSFNFTSILS